MATTLLNSFSRPPTDGSLPLSGLVDFNLENNPTHDYAVLVGSNENERESLVHVDYRHLALAVHRVAHLVNPQATLPQGTQVAILTSTSTIVNVTLVLGILRAGLVPFPISPRASVPGIFHLIASTKTHHIVVGDGAAISHLFDNVLIATKEIQHVLHSISLPSFDEIFLELAQPELKHSHEPFPCIQPASGHSIVAILHSSGSTGLPRAVSYTQAGLLTNFINQPPCWQSGEPGVRVGLMALPTFHVMGFVTQCLFPQCAGYVPVLFAPARTPVIPSPEVTLRAIVDSGCDFLLTVPIFLETWSSDPHAIKTLRNLRKVVYAGGPLTSWIGDLLVKQGVPICAAYGATEVGAPVLYDPGQRVPDDWNYVEFPDWVRPKLIPQHDEDGTFELIMMCTPRHVPFVINYHADGESGYATKDLVIPHPTKHKLMKFVGRVDDQIVLANGEKTNPVPMETEIVKCPLVCTAVMFGRERNQTGVLIELDHSKLTDETGKVIRNPIEYIWPYIERANQGASTHSRITREAILLSNPERPLPRTPKGNVARAGSLESYKNEISDIYAQLARCLPASAETFVAWRNYDAVESWLASSIESILGRKPDVCSDLFQQGLDSLTATMLLGSIKATMLAASDEEVRWAAENVTGRTIFMQATIQQLASYLFGLFDHDSSTEGNSTVGSSLDTASTAVDDMIEKYTRDLHTCYPAGVVSAPLDNIVLTGTTGSLGSHILALVLGDDKVKRVWALNRSPKRGAPPAIERQRLSFSEKMFDKKLLDHPKLEFLEVDLLDDQLGLTHECYNNIQNSVTTIIHNAWQVDFNLNLCSFEPSIRGTKNLLTLASKHAPRFVFISSISAVGIGHHGRVHAEEYIKDSSATIGFGYGESKYVAERLLENARIAGLETCIARFPQLTGDVKSGAWSKTDWLPALVASSLSIGHLPDTAGNVSWIPLDTAAKTLLDVCRGSVKSLPPVVHIAHPRPVQWSSLMAAFSEVSKFLTGQDLSLVPFCEWTKAVAKAASCCEPAKTHQNFPSTKLQTHFDLIGQSFHGDTSEQVEALGAPRLQTEVCVGLSPTLSTVPALGKDDVYSWMKHWNRVGLFEKI